jgi:hypothetical protein
MCVRLSADQWVALEGNGVTGGSSGSYFLNSELLRGACTLTASTELSFLVSSYSSYQ